MPSTAPTIVERWVDKRTLGFPFPTATAIAPGDLQWWDNSNKVSNSAANQADQGSAAANQAFFTPLFCGVMAGQRLSTDTTTGHDSQQAVVVQSVFDCQITSGTYQLGQLVGVARNSAIPANYNQQVATVATPNLAIGYILGNTPGPSGGVVYTGAATTIVRCWLDAYAFGWWASQRIGGTVPADASYSTVVIPIPANAGLANSQVYTYLPGFAGKLLSVAYRTGVPVTTGSKLATVTAGIAGTPCTGGVVSLTSATMTPTGAAVAGTAITALNVFTASQAITLTLSSVTTFIEGSGWFELTVQNTDLYSFLAGLNP